METLHRQTRSSCHRPIMPADARALEGGGRNIRYSVTRAKVCLTKANGRLLAYPILLFSLYCNVTMTEVEHTGFQIFAH